MNWEYELEGGVLGGGGIGNLGIWENVCNIVCRKWENKFERIN